MHPLFQQIQVFLRQGAVNINVIVETVVDHRADGHFGVRPQLLDSMAQQVRAGVAHDFQAFGVLDGDNRQLRIGFDQIAGIHQFTVYTAGNTGFGQTRADIKGNIQGGNGAVEMTLTSVRKSNNRH
ncbi:hypothetical protein D3C81_81490 [compost metagenome]